MSATRLELGDRVQLSRKGREAGLFTAKMAEKRPDGWKGTVVGGSWNADLVAIRRDGYTSIDRYHRTFWEPLNEAIR